MSNRKPIVLFSLLLAGLLAGAFLLRGPKPVSLVEDVRINSVPAVSPDEQAKTVTPSPTDAGPAVILSVLSDDREKNPTVEQVRAQAAENPHARPAILIEFSSRMARFMEVALSSEEAAERSAPELKKCIFSDPSEIVESARAICLVNFGRLVNVAPRLESELDEVRRNVDPRVALIAQATESL